MQANTDDIISLRNYSNLFSLRINTPTAVGKKNWLFVGGEDTGGRSAVIYTLIESAKRHGHEPYAYLKNMLERLPGTTTTGLDALMPANWKPPEQSNPLMQAAG